MFNNYKKLEGILALLNKGSMYPIMNWGHNGSVEHCRDIFNCPKCGKEATTTETVASRSRTLVGLQSCSIKNRSSVTGMLIIQCPDCDNKYFIHTGTGTIARLIDRGKWPLAGLKKEYHAEYLECFPELAKP